MWILAALNGPFKIKHCINLVSADFPCQKRVKGLKKIWFKVVSLVVECDWKLPARQGDFDLLVQRSRIKHCFSLVKVTLNNVSHTKHWCCGLRHPVLLNQNFTYFLSFHVEHEPMMFNSVNPDVLMCDLHGVQAPSLWARPNHSTTSKVAYFKRKYAEEEDLQGGLHGYFQKVRTLNFTFTVHERVCPPHLIIHYMELY